MTTTPTQLLATMRELSIQLGALNSAVGDRVLLRPGDLDLIDLVSRRPGMSPSDLASLTGTHPATLTGALDRLERGGWLARRPDPSDRRRVRLEALRERSFELAHLYGPMARAISQLCAGYSEQDIDLVHEFLSRAVEIGERANGAVRSSVNR